MLFRSCEHRVLSVRLFSFTHSASFLLWFSEPLPRVRTGKLCEGKGKMKGVKFAFFWSVALCSIFPMAPWTPTKREFHFQIEIPVKRLGFLKAQFQCPGNISAQRKRSFVTLIAHQDCRLSLCCCKPGLYILPHPFSLRSKIYWPTTGGTEEATGSMKPANKSRRFYAFWAAWNQAAKIARVQKSQDSFWWKGTKPSKQTQFLAV